MKKVKFIRWDAGWFYIYKTEDKKFNIWVDNFHSQSCKYKVTDMRVANAPKYYYFDYLKDAKKFIVDTINGIAK